MTNGQPQRFKFKRDQYSRRRGGGSKFLDLRCAKCRTHLFLYQKDGPGALLRTYLDRIFAPQPMAVLQYSCTDVGQMTTLKCPHCKAIIGHPMVYQPETRLAFRLAFGSFIKEENASGTYPPPTP